MAQNNMFRNLSVGHNATTTIMVNSMLVSRRSVVKFSDDIDYKDEPMPWETIAETDDIQELDFSHS